MDPVTHITAGVLLGQAAKDRFPGVRALVPLSALAAWMSDVDNIVTFFGAEAYMRHHRGYTHSLIGGALLAWLLALCVSRFAGGARASRLFVLFYLGVLSHIFLDCITSYGTGVFLPFSDVRVSVPSVFIIDPIYTLALIGLAVAAALRPAAGKKLAVAGLAVMLAWPAIGFGVGQAVSAHARELLVARGEKPTRVTAQPDAFAPLWWKIIAEEGNDYVLTGLTLSEPDKLLPERRFERAGRAGQAGSGFFLLCLVHGFSGQIGFRHPGRHGPGLPGPAVYRRQSAGGEGARPHGAVYPHGLS